MPNYALIGPNITTLPYTVPASGFVKIRTISTNNGAGGTVYINGVEVIGATYTLNNWNTDKNTAVYPVRAGDIITAVNSYEINFIPPFAVGDAFNELSARVFRRIK